MAPARDEARCGLSSVPLEDRGGAVRPRGQVGTRQTELHGGQAPGPGPAAESTGAPDPILFTPHVLCSAQGLPDDALKCTHHSTSLSCLICRSSAHLCWTCHSTLTCVSVSACTPTLDVRSQDGEAGSSAEPGSPPNPAVPSHNLLGDGPSPLWGEGA